MQAEWVEAAAVADGGLWESHSGKGASWIEAHGGEGAGSGGVDLSFDPCIDSIAGEKKVAALSLIAITTAARRIGDFSNGLDAVAHLLLVHLLPTDRDDLPRMKHLTFGLNNIPTDHTATSPCNKMLGITASGPNATEHKLQ